MRCSLCDVWVGARVQTLGSAYAARLERRIDELDKVRSPPVPTRARDRNGVRDDDRLPES